MPHSPLKIQKSQILFGNEACRRQNVSIASGIPSPTIRRWSVHGLTRPPSAAVYALTLRHHNDASAAPARPPDRAETFRKRPARDSKTSGLISSSRASGLAPPLRALKARFQYSPEPLGQAPRRSRQTRAPRPPPPTASAVPIKSSQCAAAYVNTRRSTRSAGGLGVALR